MKNLLLIVTMFLIMTTSSYAEPGSTPQAARDFVNSQISVMVDILNLSLTKLNITSCASIAPGRANDSFTVAMPAGWANEVLTNPAYRMIIVHETPVKVGMERRIKIYTEGSTIDAPVVDLAHLGAIVEFTCDDSNTANRMKKGYLVQTGNPTEVLEAYWDNTLTTPSVQFRLVGLKDDGVTPIDIMYVLDATHNFNAAQGSVDYTGLVSYLHDFGINYRGPTCHSNASTVHGTLVTAGCEINN